MSSLISWRASGESRWWDISPPLSYAPRRPRLAARRGLLWPESLPARQPWPIRLRLAAFVILAALGDASQDYLADVISDELIGDMVSVPMKLLRKEQSLVLWCFSASLLLSSCGGAGPECGSLDTRNSVVKIVSDDNNNKLVNYAVKNSSSVAAMVGDTKSEAEKLAIWEKARQGAVYRLDDTVLMNSRNRAAHEVTCIGLLYVTVADATAQKELEFKVKQTADGKIIVSVNPFLF